MNKNNLREFLFREFSDNFQNDNKDSYKVIFDDGKTVITGKCRIPKKKYKKSIFPPIGGKIIEGKYEEIDDV